MEQQILKACLSSRHDFALIKEYVDVDRYSKEFKYLLKFISDYYARDTGEERVRTDLLKAQIAESTLNEKHVQRFVEAIDRADAAETSGSNVTAVIILAKIHEAKIRLATALANGDSEERVTELIERFRKLSNASSLSDIEDQGEAEILDTIDIDKLSQERLAKGGLLRLYPKSLTDKTDGGVEGGDHIVLYGPTEIGKSAASIQLACGFANQDAKGLYLINEDKTSRIAQRLVHCLSNMNKFDCMNEPAKAQQLANDRGLGNIVVVGLAPGSLGQIEALIEKYDPRWVVVDQLRNIITGTKNNRVVQLEEAATGMRNILKASNVVGVSVTQAGDSATNKPYLEVGDVDFSNVGIPAQADLMIGIGATESMLALNERGISLPKNKLSGDHAKYVVRIVPELSQIRDV